MSRKVLLLIALVLAVSACSVDTIYLPALLADPMADYAPDGTELVDAWEHREHPGFLGGMPGYAEVGREHRIDDSEMVDAVVEATVSHAEDVGWRVQHGEIGCCNYSGSRALEPGPGRLHIGYGPDDDTNPNGSWHISIILDFGPVGFDDTTTTTLSSR